MALTYDNAIDQLRTNSSAYSTRESLLALVKEATLDANAGQIQGLVTVLYGGAVSSTAHSRGGVRDGEQWSHYKMWCMAIPEAFKPHEAEIMADLKEAFAAYKGGGVFSSAATHTATFDF